MIDLTILPLFFTAIFFLAISPGPDLVLISSYSSVKGFKAGWMISIGIFGAGILQTVLVALGLGQLMQSFPLIAYTIKIVGALYLSYLGIKMLVSWRDNKFQQKQAGSADNASNLSLINKGFLNNLLNPKALLFFSLFLPQFTSSSNSVSGQIFVLGVILSLFTLLINIAFAIAFSNFGKLVGSKLNLGRHIDGLLGVIFLGVATRLATSK